MSKRSKTTGSYLMLIASMLIFGTIGIFRRYIPLSSGLLACARGLMGSAFLFIFIKLKGKKLRHHIGARNLILLFCSGAAMGINWIFLFEAYNYTTVATATLCYYMQPTIVILLSPLLFKESLTAKKLICAALSIVGMVFVSGFADGGQISASDTKGIVFGLAAAALYATVVILNKKLVIEDAYEKTIIQLFSAALVLIPYLLLTEDFAGISLGRTSVIMILIVGLVHTGIAYALYFSSMANLKAQSVAVLSYIDPVSSLILSFLILSEKLTVLGIAGAVLIIGAALVSELGGKPDLGAGESKPSGDSEKTESKDLAGNLDDKSRSEAEIGERLIGRETRHYDSLDSTNDEIKRLADAGAEEGLVVTASEQLHGRGRQGRTFYSSRSKGLYYSCLLRPKAKPEDALKLTAPAAVAACEAIEKCCGVRPEIKWPNDIVLNRKKIGGILCEMNLKADLSLDYIVIGVGINCNQLEDDFPPDIQSMASSVIMETGKNADCKALADALSKELDLLYKAFPGNLGECLDAYKEDCCTLGRQVKMIGQSGSETIADAIDIDEDFALIVRLSDGSEERVSSGEVFVRGLFGYTD